jgi:hypothetical protein
MGTEEYMSISSSISIFTSSLYQMFVFLSISSHIELNCTQSLSITTSWKILTCSSSGLDEAQLDRSVETTLNELFNPSQTLSNCRYELILTVRMVDLPALQTSSSIYLEIVRSNIITNLLAFDKPMVIHDYQQDLVLNPGEFSVDLNAITFYPNVSFKFQCHTNDVNLIVELGLFILLSDLFNKSSRISII